MIAILMGLKGHDRRLDMWIVPLLIFFGLAGIVTILVLAEKDGF